jgi:hypothetical protein
MRTVADFAIVQVPYRRRPALFTPPPPPLTVQRQLYRRRLKENFRYTQKRQLDWISIRKDNAIIRDFWSYWLILQFYQNMFFNFIGTESMAEILENFDTWKLIIHIPVGKI